MKKGKFMSSCGLFIVGCRFRAADDSESPMMEFEIIERGLKDINGFPAVRLRFADGVEEVAAIDILADGIDQRGLILL